MESKGLKLNGVNFVRDENNQIVRNEKGFAQREYRVEVDGEASVYVDHEVDQETPMRTSYGIAECFLTGGVKILPDTDAMLLGVKQSGLPLDKISQAKEAVIDGKPNGLKTVFQTYFCINRKQGLLGVSTSDTENKFSFGNWQLKPQDGQELVLVAIRTDDARFSHVFINQKFQAVWDKYLGSCIKLLRGEKEEKGQKTRLVKAGKDVVKVESVFIQEVPDPDHVKETLENKYDFPLFAYAENTPGSRPFAGTQILGINKETGQADTVNADFFPFLTCSHTGVHRGKPESEFVLDIQEEQETKYYLYTVYRDSLLQNQTVDGKLKNLETVTIGAKKEEARKAREEAVKKAQEEERKAIETLEVSFSARDDVKGLTREQKEARDILNKILPGLKLVTEGGVSLEEARKQNADLNIFLLEKDVNEAKTPDEKAEARKALDTAKTEQARRQAQSKIDALTESLKGETEPNLKADLEKALAEAVKERNSLMPEPVFKAPKK